MIIVSDLSGLNKRCTGDGKKFLKAVVLIQINTVCSIEFANLSRSPLILMCFKCAAVHTHVHNIVRLLT